MDAAAEESLEVESSPEMNCAPHIGMEFDTIEEAYGFYNIYGRYMGFSVQIYGTNNSHRDNMIIYRKFVCSKEGTRKPDKRDWKTKNSRAETRTECPAFMCISLNRDTGKFLVSKFETTHNHDLHLVQCGHMMRSQRKISATQGINAVMAADCGIPLRLSYDLMSKQAGGRENVGFIKEDQKSYLRGRRQQDMQWGVTSTLVNYFKEQVAANPLFYYCFQ